MRFGFLLLFCNVGCSVFFFVDLKKCFFPSKNGEGGIDYSVFVNSKCGRKIGEKH